MGMTCRRILALVGLVVGFASLAAVALPGFSDQNIAAGNLNPTDTIEVQRIRVTRGAGETVTLASITVQNLGTARDGHIDKITVMDGGDILGEATAIAGLPTGITVNLGGFHMTSTTHFLKIFVTVGTAVDGGETVNLRVRVHYVSNGSSYTSAWITDLTGETIRKGGFDVIADSSPAAGYMNPTDQDIVQITVFSDVDANGRPVQWQGGGATPAILVENLGTATVTDIDEIRVTLTIGGTEYQRGFVAWVPVGATMTFPYADFAPAPPEIPDNGVLTVKIELKIKGAGTVTDGRTIRTKTTVRVQEQGQDTIEPPVQYSQSSSSATTQVIRKQGFEEIRDESTSLGSGTAATGDVIVQTVRAIDSDRNAANVTTTHVYIRNNGTAEAADIQKIEVKAGAQTLRTLNAGDFPNLRTGAWYPLTTPFIVLDDREQVFKIYYTIGTPVDGRTLKPAVRFRGEEAATAYDSDEVVYPDTLALYLPGFEFVENMTPPEGGVAYSAQRILAQTIRCEDRDEDNDNVTIHPVVVKNIGTASGNPDVTKIEVWRRDTLTSTPLKLGETTDLSGFRTGGARVELTHDNVVTDKAGGSETYLDIYLTIAEPEHMVAGRTIQLETRVLHTENLQSFDKMAASNQWTLETNRRPVPAFTVAAAAATASITPKADFTYEQTIQFTGSATDPDGDAITGWLWDFGDGSTSTEQNPTHRYPNGGTFTITLTVTDARGVTGSVSKTITVEGPPNAVPTVTFTWTPESPAENQTVTFTATVTDPDQPAGTPHTYEWDFGDETAKSTLASPTHQFTEKKTYTVKLTVTDAQSASVTVQQTISVGNTPPVVGTLTATPTAPKTGDDVQFTAQNVTDADEGDTIASYKWAFGDGGTQTTTAPTATATHRYNAPGTYTASVIAVDGRGAESAPKTLIVTVEGPAQAVLSAYPNPASVQATFIVLLPEGATDTVLAVYALNGEKVFEEDLAAGVGSFIWDLRDAAGDPVGNGLYFCVVTARKAGGGTARSEIFRLLVSR